jgi:tetratricopeptide (TPR) repeat protein
MIFAIERLQFVAFTSHASHRKGIELVCKEPSMTRFSSVSRALLAAVSVAALTALPMTAALAKEKKQEAGKAPATGKMTKEVHKLMVEVDKAMKASDFATAKTNLFAADAIPTKNSYDMWLISQYLFDLGKKTNDTAMVNNSFERMVSNEFLPKQYTPGTLNYGTVTQSLFNIEYNKKNYPNAIAWGEKYLEANPGDGNFLGELVKIALISKDYVKAETLTLRSISASKAAGQKPSEFQYTALAEVYQTQKSPKFNQALRDLISAYPTPKNWKFLLQDFQIRTKMTDKSGLDLYRLMYATGMLDSQADILDYAFTAFDAGFASESQRIIETNMASGKIGKGSADAKDTLVRAKSAIASDVPLAQQEAKAAAAKTGDQDLFVGNTYIGLGNYAKAVDILKRAIGKGVRDKNSANLKLGIAQLMSGDVAAAKTSFAAVAGDAKQNELASYWSLFASTK